MTDTPEKLRKLAEFQETAAPGDPCHDPDLLIQAADEIEQLRSQLPEGMEDCTIQFRECEKGHGWLTATNWVEHGCQQCEIERLKQELADELGRSITVHQDAALLEHGRTKLLRGRLLAQASLIGIAEELARHVYQPIISDKPLDKDELRDLAVSFLESKRVFDEIQTVSPTNQ